ncbi:Aste57867_2651 [Aphanomyces stellatus]|uniref:Aste57867_2651 protein n=1 Tax=Aphanomyces stellatus TaxID=120398 RepID=A0A485KCA3_9STRA|nr:hypothetical protein As57867_002644 [Aphanomyces stellatus]VFT79845.1 Aste57867_2651 [Aphanomyces stellatus]
MRQSIQLAIFLLAASYCTAFACRWNSSNVTTNCIQRGKEAYLLNQSLSQEIDPRNLNLSFLDIQSIEGPWNQWPHLTHLYVLNLSHNAIANVHQLVANLPPTIQSLDLSYNHLVALDSVSWGVVLPHLTTLLLTGNNITSFKNTTFPSTLQTLDLARNSIDTIELSRATFFQLAAMPSLSLRTTKQRGAATGIPLNPCDKGKIVYLSTNVYCVLDPHPSTSSSASSWDWVIRICIATVLICGVVAKIMMMRAKRWDNTVDDVDGLRKTFVSSEVDETEVAVVHNPRV